MRTTTTVVEKQVERAQLGFWSVTPSTTLPFGSAPFLKSREDLEAVLRQPGLVASGQPVELSGYSVHRILRAAIGLEERFEREGGGQTYEAFTNVHAPVVSFPGDLIWLAHPEHVDTFLRGFEETLPMSQLYLSPEESARAARGMRERLVPHPQSFTFWRMLTGTLRGTKVTYARCLLEYAITTANRSRARAFAGAVPCLDPRTPGSVALSHRFNMAYGSLVGDRQDQGLRPPAYLYTLIVNSNMIEPDTWNRFLENAVLNAKKALETSMFDGLHLTVRWLSRISLSAGRTNVVNRLVERLGSVAQNADMPLWWSRPGLIGLAGMDLGCSFFSYRLNLNIDDVYVLGGPVVLKHQFGKILNPVVRQIWDRAQVMRSMSGPDHGMPDLGTAGTVPTEEELEKPRKYRVHFSKPYNITAFRHLSEDWRGHVGSGETQPGREYLQIFEAPYNQWGLP